MLCPEVYPCRNALTGASPHACAGVQHKLVDFDEHLDDASKDWFNTSLLS